MATSIKKHTEEITIAMKKAETYRPEFATAIKQLATRLRDQELTRAEYRNGGSKQLVLREGKNGSEYHVKNPLLSIMDAQNRDVDGLLAALGLTPVGLKRINDEMRKKPKATSVLGAKVGVYGSG